MSHFVSSTQILLFKDDHFGIRLLVRHEFSTATKDLINIEESPVQIYENCANLDWVKSQPKDFFDINMDKFSYKTDTI